MEPEHSDSAAVWLNFSDHLHWPHVFLAHTHTDVRAAYLEMADAKKRAVHVDKVWAWSKSLRTRVSGILKSQLHYFLGNYAKGDVCEYVPIRATNQTWCGDYCTGRIPGQFYYTYSADERARHDAAAKKAEDDADADKKEKRRVRMEERKRQDLNKGL